MLTLLASLLLFSTPVSADTADGPRAIHEAIVQYIAPFTTDMAATDWTIQWADLNDDAIDDALVTVAGPDWCGSNGCTLVVFETITGDDVQELGAYRPMAEISQIHQDVLVADTMTEGWRDLIAQDGEGQMRRLRFNGESYPQSPSGGEVVERPARLAVFADA